MNTSQDNNQHNINVSRDATDAEIRETYTSMGLSEHPDKIVGSEDMSSKSHLIFEAKFEVVQEFAQGNAAKLHVEVDGKRTMKDSNRAERQKRREAKEVTKTCLRDSGLWRGMEGRQSCGNCFTTYLRALRPRRSFVRFARWLAKP
ncbi:uncharacterized protein BCR38DRAFT_472320 [Pseudomassariella vexata]|uniref:J domain-containing protein n=1 Tax=Pseudomassariella vexata TaxID=1141098 RepID=A0A1Y2EBD7_9PEZI|nr:uncharacterized protein BCR38DRAFT_472320 [Pseudomassariella vexata]ORY68871.1 hypothetical protein BCR38DRAFT_472320 [Pseudomassariella vexata]